MAILKGFPPSNTISPSVRITEKDLSFYDIGNSFHRVGLVGFASKGPIGIPTQIRSQRELTNIFGHPHPDVGDPYLVYAATQYLTIANELWIVRVGDTSPTSWEQAKLAEVDVQSAGGQVLVESVVTEGITSWQDPPDNTIPDVGTGNYTFNKNMYFKWKLNGVLASKTLQILADDNRPAPLTGLAYTALQLREDLNFQLSVNDGIEFYVDTTVSAGSRKIGVFATNSYGPSSSIEFVSVYSMALGGTIQGSGGTNVLGLGTLMTRAILTGTYDGYPSTGSLYSAGSWDFTSLGASVDLQLQVVIDGTDLVTIDNIVQVVDLNDLKGSVVTTADVVHAINTYITDHLPGGFQAVGGDAGGIAGVKPVDDLKAITPVDLNDATLASVLALDNVTLISNTFGRDSRVYIKPESTAEAYFGFGNTTAEGTSPVVYAGDADNYTGGIVLGSENSTGDVTFTITGDTAGIDGNDTMVSIITDPRTGTFTLEVYNNGTQVETWGNLTKELSSRFYVETFTAIVSDWVRVLDNVTNPALPLPGDYYLSGGSDGIPADPDDQDVLLIGDLNAMTGIYTLSEPEQIDIDLIAVPGHSSSYVMEALIDVCANQRMDCLAIIDPPFGLYINEIIQWHNGVHPLNSVKLDSDFAALYWPWVKLRDGYNLIDVWVPPSGSILAVYAQSDRMSAPWFAPAGLRRGMVPNISDVFDRPTLEERDLLYGWRNAVNPIVQFSDVEGFVVWGQKTLQRRPTALDRVNVRRMMFVAEKRIRKASRYLLFEPHDDLFHQQFINLSSAILEDIKAGRGLTAYRIQADWELNTPDKVDRNEFWARIGIQPTKAVEFIFIEFSIHRTGSWDSNAEIF